MIYYLNKYYKYPPSIIVTLGKFIGYKNDDDVSVCMCIGRDTRLDPRDVMGLKNRGLSWKEIIKTTGFQPSTLFKKAGFDYFDTVPHRFEHAFSEYKKWKKNPSYQMDLSDDEVRDLVQLNLVIHLFGVTAQNMMKARDRGARWSNIILAGGR